MKVTRCETITCEIIEFENDETVYERYSPNCWRYQIGESTESCYNCEELERAYQEFKTKPP